MDEAKTDSGATAIDVCVQHARDVLASQLPLIKDKGYDFAPDFRRMTIQLYLLGVMWRCGEGLDLPIDPREHAFVALQSMLISDGMRRETGATADHIPAQNVTSGRGWRRAGGKHGV